MAIAAGDGIWKFGTETALDDGTTDSVADGAYSLTTAAGIAIWANTDDTPQASFELTMQYPSGTIDTGGILLFASLLNGNGTIDEPPTSNNWQGHFLGAFQTGTGMVAATDYTLQLGPVDLPVGKSGQEYQFYLKIDCNVTMSANWQFDVTPMTIGPKA